MRTGASNRGKLHRLEALFDAVERAKYIWESTFDAIINPVAIVDREYRIQRANIAFAQAVGEDVRKLTGQICYRVFARQDRPCKGCPLSYAWQEHPSISSALEKFSDDREYQATGFHLKGNKNDLDLFIIQYRDIGQERFLQAKLIQSEKMAAIGLLSGGIAHEINNPLGGILAFAQLALRQVQEGDQVYEDLKEIETSALRCKKIVENLLEFSRQSISEEREKIDLRQVIEKVLPLLRVQVKEVNAHLLIDTEAETSQVLANVNQLEQVLLNLTTNACHALSPGGEILIKVTQSDAQWVQIDFSDNGRGIKKEHLPRIFDTFFTTKNPNIGTGLGLSITYNIIQDHGGKLEVESRENRGTTFHIFLPAISSDRMLYSSSYSTKETPDERAHSRRG